MRNAFIFTLAIFMTISQTIRSQIAINSDGSLSDPSAMLDIKSTEMGFLLPRMTRSELNNISDPAEGLLVYCTNCGLNGSGCLSIFIGEAWFTLSANCMNPLSPVEGTHVALVTWITWHWNSVTGATGYKWNTINDSTTAIDMVTNTYHTETGLNGNTTYTRFVWAYNSCGISTATTLTKQTLDGLYIGQSLFGGIVFYIDGTGDHGMVSAPVDQSLGATWGCPGTYIGTSTDMEMGFNNTVFILLGCNTPGIAAQICNYLYLGEYYDWFLPSKDELNEMYQHKTAIGGFHNEYYWSSSEGNSSLVYTQHFLLGNQPFFNKGSNCHVRCIKNF
jgi:hypothetical protein